jgi:hypothetical protein
MSSGDASSRMTSTSGDPSTLRGCQRPSRKRRWRSPEPESFDPGVEVDVHDVQQDADPNHIPLDDDGIDPALREIVNSLTNAQQVS